MNKLSRIILILLISFLLTSCGATIHDTIIKGTRIDLPVPPKPLGIKGNQDVTPEKNTIVDPPYVAEPFQYWRAYKDGAIIWKPKDWRLIDEYIKSSQNWINLAIDRVKVHNNYFSTEGENNSNKKWYNNIFK